MILNMTLKKVNRTVENKEELNDLAMFSVCKDHHLKTKEEVEKEIESMVWTEEENAQAIKDYKKERRWLREEKEKIMQKYKNQDIKLEKIKYWRRFYFLDTLFEDIYRRKYGDIDHYILVVLEKPDIEEIIQKLKDSKRNLGDTVKLFENLLNTVDFDKETLYYVSSLQ